MTMTEMADNDHTSNYNVVDLTTSPINKPLYDGVVEVEVNEIADKSPKPPPLLPAMTSHPNTTTNNNDDPTKTKTAVSTGVACAICGNPAAGTTFGFDSCNPCKKFFQRHRFDRITDIRCELGGRSVCDLSKRRPCTKCRLLRCLRLSKQTPPSFLRDADRNSRQIHKHRNVMDKLRSFIVSDRKPGESSSSLQANNDEPLSPSVISFSSSSSSSNDEDSASSSAGTSQLSVIRKNSPPHPQPLLHRHVTAPPLQLAEKPLDFSNPSPKTFENNRLLINVDGDSSSDSDAGPMALKRHRSAFVAPTLRQSPPAVSLFPQSNMNATVPTIDLMVPNSAPVTAPSPSTSCSTPPLPVSLLSILRQQLVLQQPSTSAAVLDDNNAIANNNSYFSTSSYLTRNMPTTSSVNSSDSLRDFVTQSADSIAGSYSVFCRKFSDLIGSFTEPERLFLVQNGFNLKPFFSPSLCDLAAAFQLYYAVLLTPQSNVSREAVLTGQRQNPAFAELAFLPALQLCQDVSTTTDEHPAIIIHDFFHRLNQNWMMNFHSSSFNGGGDKDNFGKVVVDDSNNRNSNNNNNNICGSAV